MLRPIVHEGRTLTVVFAVLRDGSSPAKEFFDGLATPDKAKLATLFKRLGEFGKIFNKEKFKKLEDTDFYEFKSGQIRMPCYYLPNRHVVVTHGFLKKSGKTPRQQLKRAQRIKNEDTAANS